jgi:hypothetical protein
VVRSVADPREIQIGAAARGRLAPPGIAVESIGLDQDRCISRRAIQPYQRHADHGPWGCCLAGNTPLPGRERDLLALDTDYSMDQIARGCAWRRRGNADRRRMAGNRQDQRKQHSDESKQSKQGAPLRHEPTFTGVLRL